MATALVCRALLALGMLGSMADGLPTPGDLPAPAVVTDDEVQAFAEPRDDATALERLVKGRRLQVLDVDRTGGWITITPTDAAFAWVDQSTVRPEGPSRARVTSPNATLRDGVPGARSPGPARRELRLGTSLRLIDRPGLETGVGRDRRYWLAVECPEGDVRYLKARGVTWMRPERPEAPAETRTSYSPSPETPRSVEPPFEASDPSIADVEEEHQAVLSGPIESWRLEPIRTRYEALRSRVTDPEALAAIDDRLDLVARHEAMARSARAFATILARSRRRDQDVETTRRDLAELNKPSSRPFVAEGLVQPSSRQVDGRRVYALIGNEGSPIAYLDVPAGLDARPVVSKRVGVRGTVRFDEGLRSRLISVRDLESLE